MGAFPREDMHILLFSLECYHSRSNQRLSLANPRFPQPTLGKEVKVAAQSIPSLLAFAVTSASWVPSLHPQIRKRLMIVLDSSVSFSGSILDL